MLRLATSRCLRASVPVYRELFGTSIPALTAQHRPSTARFSSSSSSSQSSEPKPSQAGNSSSSSSSSSTSSPPTSPISFIERAKRDGSASLVGPFPSSDGYDSLLSAMTVDRMDPSGHTTCTLPLSPSTHQPVPLHNSHNRLHGGLHALLVDVVGTLALLAMDGKRGGVSVSIQCDYVEAVELTDTLRCEGRVLKLGGRLGFTEVLLYRQSDGKLVAAGKHIKAM